MTLLITERRPNAKQLNIFDSTNGRLLLISGALVNQLTAQLKNVEE